MSAPSPARNSISSADAPRQAKGLTWTATISLTLIAAVVLCITTEQFESNVSLTLEDIAILASSLFATVACARAARRRDAMARGWALMGAATLIWSFGQAIFTYYGLTRDHVYPFPSAADAAYLGYAILAIAALFAFPRPPALLISRVRVVLDALVIGAGIVIISESAVLQLHEALGSGMIARWVGLAYPILEISIAAVVLSLGMGQPSGQRLLWLVLGTGLITLTVTDSIYVRLLAGQSYPAIMAGPLTGGWMLTFFLIGLATLVPTRATADRPGRGFAFGIQLIPYVPVVGALIVLIFSVVTDDTFVFTMATVLLILISIRQVMIVYENVTLTSELEARVAERTTELNTMGSIVTSSSDAIVGVSLDGIIIAWNPAADQLYGHRAEDVIGRPPDFLTTESLQGMHGLLTQARSGQELSSYEVPCRARTAARCRSR